MRHQVHLLALIAVSIDATLFVLSGAFAVAPVKSALFVLLIPCVGAALIAPPRFAGLTWIFAASVQAIGSLTFHNLPVTLPVTGSGFLSAGFLTAGFLAGAFLRGWPRQAVPVFVVGELIITDLRVHADLYDELVSHILQIGIAAALPYLVGRYIAANLAHIAVLKNRLQRQQLAEAAALERAIALDRAAIARDLHDAISHHVSATGINAGAARRALQHSNAAAARRSLEAIEHSCTAAAADLRRQLDLLQQPQRDGSRRQPGLANIEEIVESVEYAGLATTIDINAELTDLPSSLDVTVYRVVQELLTNALKHGAGQADLAISATAETLLIVQSNPVAGTASTGSQSTRRGLTGIRERIEMFGGTFEYDFDNTLALWRAVITIPTPPPENR